MALPSWLPAALALVGVLGPTLLARRIASRALARALALIALVGLAVYAVASAFGSGEARLFALADALLGGALVALTALAHRRLLLLGGLLASALALARAFAILSTALDAPQGAPLLAAAMWGVAAVLGAGILGARLMLSFRRSTRRGTPRGGSPPS